MSPPNVSRPHPNATLKGIPRSPITPGGPLTPRMIGLVQGSWDKVMPISDAAATLFYDRLFELDPQVRPLFKSDMTEQKKKLMQTLNVAVGGLQSVDKLVPVLQDLGRRHAGYMVEEHHYDLVGQALLWTLKEGLGDDFNAETERAWAAVYGLVAGVMKGAARGEAGPVADLAAAGPGSQPGPLDSRTVELVQSSWAGVRPISDAAATLFYDRLFELDPEVKGLFKSDMTEQKKKLMQTLTVAVDGLRAPEKLIPVLENLGIRHAGYMVQPHHYGLVGEALLWTLHEGLGDDFTDEIRAAWVKVYGFVAETMQRAAARHGGGSASSDAAPRGKARGFDSDDESPTFTRQRAAQALSAASAAPAAQPMALTVPLAGDDGTIKVHLTLEQPSLQSSSQASAAPGKSRPPSGIGMAILLAIVVGTSVLTALSVLLFSTPGITDVLANVPPLLIYAPPLAAAILTSSAFLLGYLWRRYDS